MKYDFTLDMDSDNSNSLILREITANSSILEFGPAHGRMTKYLKNNLNCSICIVEKDIEAGKQASQFAEKFCIGTNGEIEQYFWKTYFYEKNFDYIIFADVLEHLYDPWKVLSEAKHFLKDNGYILISVPNISHNGVIIDLINDNFQYRELGLLDWTHVRFFTRKTLLEMVHKANLNVIKEIDARCAVEHTELKNNFGCVSPFVEEVLRKRKDGDIYQFIWKLKKS